MKGAKIQLPENVKDAIAGQVEAHGKPAELAEYVCPICKNHAFSNPVSTTCPAGHLFHETCIKRCLASKPSCPTCRHSLPSWKDQFKPVQTFVRSTINKGKVQCPQGCGAVLPFEQLQTHVNDVCPKTNFACTNNGCAMQCSRNDMEGHIPRCYHALVSCAQCQVKVKKGTLQAHGTSTCSYRKIDCDRCGSKIVFRDAEDHKKVCSGGAQVSDIAALKELVLEQSRQIAQMQRDRERDQENLRCLEARVEQAVGLPLAHLCIQVTSIETPNAAGRYTLLPERHNDRPVWGKGKWRLFYYSSSGVMITDATEDMQQNTGLLSLDKIKEGASAPIASERWEVWRDSTWAAAPGTCTAPAGL